jgi:hypothetical protein
VQVLFWSNKDSPKFTTESPKPKVQGPKSKVQSRRMRDEGSLFVRGGSPHPPRMLCRKSRRVPRPALPGRVPYPYQPQRGAITPCAAGLRTRRREDLPRHGRASTRPALPGRVPYVLTRPDGAADCSRGWSSARCKRAERNPWKRRRIDTPAPRGAEEVTARETDQSITFRSSTSGASFAPSKTRRGGPGRKKDKE